MEALEGYTEDKRSRRKFFWWYDFITVPALLGFIGIFICVFCDVIPLSIGSWCALAGCLAAGIGVMIHAYFSTPCSARTGKPMQVYRNLSAPEGVLELVYVDAESRSYFRLIYLQPDK